MTLLHQRQQKQMSAIKKPWEQEVNNVAMTEKKIGLTKVWEKLTTSDNKDKDTATTTQAHFAEVTGVLNEATCFSQSWAPLWAWLWRQCQYCTQKKTHMKLTEAMIEVWGLIGVAVWVSKREWHNEIAMIRQLSWVDVGVVQKKSWKKVKGRKKIYSHTLQQWIALSAQQVR